MVLPPAIPWTVIRSSRSACSPFSFTDLERDFAGTTSASPGKRAAIWFSKPLGPAPPRVNIQNQSGVAKPYQVGQILAAIGRLEDGDMAASGEAPPQPIADRRYSGRFQVRTRPELHRRLALRAAEANLSLNRIVNDQLSKALSRDGSPSRDEAIPNRNRATE